MKKYLAVLLAVFVLLTGAIMQEYDHVANRDGTSVLIKSFKLSMLGNIDEPALQKFCSENHDYGCSIADGNMEVMIAVEKTNEYYAMGADYGLPFVTYTLTLRSIPNDLFSEKINNILKANAYADMGKAEPLDVSRKDAEAAAFLKTYGDISYAVEMPGSVTEANVGEKSGSTAAFMLSDAFQKDGPVVIKSQEINFGYLLLLAMIIVLVAFALTFLKKAPKSEEMPEPRPKAKKRK